MSAMIIRKPGPPFDRLIDCLWYSERGLLAHRRERMLPTGAATLIIHLRQKRVRVYGDAADQEGIGLGGMVLHGPQSRYYVSDKSRPDAVIGVHFRPGGAAAFFDCPGGELMDRHLDLRDVWDCRVGELHGRMLEAGSPAARFELIEQALLRRMTAWSERSARILQALRQLEAMPTVARIAAVQDASGYSAKHFIQLFRDHTGMSPKLFSRILRFQTMIDRLARGAPIDWAGLAAAGGYCDQSHLIRDFRQFTGLTPASYRPVAVDRPNHVALPD